jgi:hypothetical protein
MNLISKLTVILFFSVFLDSFARTTKARDIEWVQLLRQNQIQSVHVCGANTIGLGTKSLRRDVMLGSPSVGYVLKDMVDVKTYFDLLTQYSRDEARVELQAAFLKSHLLRIAAATGPGGSSKLTDLGPPEKIKFSFTASVKDCMEGAKTTLGADCSRTSLKNRKGCCSEKIVGPTLIWGKNSEITISYTPDPSVALKVKGEKGSRFCNVQELLVLP